VDPRLLARWADRLQSRSGDLDHALPRDMDWRWITEPASWSRSSTILVCCLSCLRSEPDDPSERGNPLALVAPFARAHYYYSAAFVDDIGALTAAAEHRRCNGSSH